jgi:hypothetical protein
MKLIVNAARSAIAVGEKMLAVWTSCLMVAVSVSIFVLIAISVAIISVRVGLRLNSRGRSDGLGT